ncbi:hypothetical protein ACI8B_160038 [Acinetobacter proteolyticus]|uniref:Uncharacterized protein n=1 Tax=Acinetobacter proteolyticus TaxID=1776741 RepID=A0A653K2F9_9GAMM|nr:hypothetical protein ACI8B_160038 [Acinetobacter proteolyticus]
MCCSLIRFELDVYKNNSQYKFVRFLLDFLNDNYYHLSILCFESDDREQNPYACR